MDMQGMAHRHMQHHNTFWRANQAVVTFHSSTPLISEEGVYQGDLILEQLDLERQRQELNAFLAENDVNYTLNFYQPIEYQANPEARPSQMGDSQESHPAGETVYQHAEYKSQSGFNPPPGIYLFGLSKPIESPFGEIATSIVAFFNFTHVDKGTSHAENTMAAMEDISTDDKGNSGSHMQDNGNDQAHDEPPPGEKNVVRVVNTFNNGLRILNSRNVPIGAASPNWWFGGTEYVPQGCPLIPPIPVKDACSYWHFHLPQLSSSELQDMTGEGVTVFVLDSLPQRDVISDAVTRAGDDNLLLFDVGRNVTFNYEVWNNWVAQGGDPMIPELAVGKDVYGDHYAFEMPDHGLFIAGIVHDIAPHARVECIRVLSDYCVGDSDLFLKALNYIQNRMLPGGDLYQKPVVINLSNVMPTLKEAESEGMDPNAGVSAGVLTNVLRSIQALTGRGAIIVASVGNEADVRENGTGTRPPALHPAAFANSPDNIGGIIPVGAVDKDGKATSYSSYPGENGIATYGGEIPSVDPPEPHVGDPVVTVDDAVRGIHSSGRYPALSKEASDPQYKAPNDRGWAYWVGTSFATPIISAVAARVLEWQLKGGTVGDVRAAIINAAGATQTTWDNLDLQATGVATGSATGPVLLAYQECQVMDEDEDD